MEEVEGSKNLVTSLGGDFVIIQNGGACLKSGTVYLEARMKDDAYGWDTVQAN